SLVGDFDLGSRRDRVCRRLHAGPESSRRQASAWRLVSEHYALYRQLLDRRRSLVSRVTTRCGGAGWRVAFYVTSAGPFVMVGVCLWLAPRKPAPAHGHLLDFRPVLRNRAALGYILGYGAHCFELYGMRTWIVAFWAFVVAQSNDGAFVGPITVSVIVTLLSLPASVLGNEAALRFGRHRAITAVSGRRGRPRRAGDRDDGAKMGRVRNAARPARRTPDAGLPPLRHRRSRRRRDQDLGHHHRLEPHPHPGSHRRRHREPRCRCRRKRQPHR